MHNTLFITVAGGLVQNVDVTDDLADTKVVVIDFDVEGEEHCTRLDDHDCVIFEYPISKIGDGDIPKFEDILRRTK